MARQQGVNPKAPVLAAIALWSWGPLLQKLISDSSQFLLLAVVFACGLATFSLILWIRHGKGAWRQLRHFRLAYMVMGLCGYFGYMVSMNQSFRHFGSAAGTTMLNYTWPVFTVVFTEAIFRRAPKPRSVRLVEGLGTALGFAAMYILATRGRLLSLQVANLPGLVWGLLGGALYGLFSGYSSIVPAEAHPVFLLTAIGTSLLAMLPLAWAERGLIGQLPPHAYLFAAAQGALMNGLGYFFWTTAVRLAREQAVPVTTVTSLVFFLPLTSLTVISLVLGDREVFQPYFAATLLLLLLGLALCQWCQWIARPRRVPRGAR